MRLPGSFEAGEEYSEQKVAQLKDALLESLKSATNIRNLKSDDSITVCVFGGPGVGPGVYRGSSGMRGTPQRPPANPPAPGGPVPRPEDPATGLPVPSTEPSPGRCRRPRRRMAGARIDPDDSRQEVGRGCLRQRQT